MKRNIRITIKWTLILSGWILAIVLGYWGFHLYFRSISENRSALDLAYLTIQLFLLESGMVDGKIPWQLEVARFLAPVAAASTLVGAAYNLFAQEFRLFGLKFRGGHVVLCGLGKKGSHLVHELIKKREHVLVIEPDILNPNITECRNLGALVLEAEANNNTVLRRARIDKASRLIAVTGDDNVNIDTAIRARQLILKKGRRSGYDSLQCISHVTDPAFRQKLKSRRIYQDDDDPFDLELVSVYETGARIMIDKSELFHYKDTGGSGSLSMNVLIAGFGQLGRTLLLRIAKEWRLERRNVGSVELSFTIIDLKADEKETWFCEHYHEFLDGIKLNFINCDVRKTQPEKLSNWCLVCDSDMDQFIEATGPSHSDSSTQIGRNAAFVCFDNDVVAAEAALNLDENQNIGANIPIVVRYSEIIGYASLINEDSEKKTNGKSRIHGIGFLDITCRDDQFLGEDVEIIARAFHEHYLREIARKGKLDPENKPAHHPWHELDENNRESNIELAKDIDRKLELIKRKKIAVTDHPIDPYPLPDDDIETLAQDEHENRWCKEKRKNGWKWAEERNDDRKEHPMLTDWENLSPEGQKFNLTLMEALPAILAAADFALEKSAESAM